jgi:hypothetical protein
VVISYKYTQKNGMLLYQLPVDVTLCSRNVGLISLNELGRSQQMYKKSRKAYGLRGMCIENVYICIMTSPRFPSEQRAQGEAFIAK